MEVILLIVIIFIVCIFVLFDKSEYAILLGAALGIIVIMKEQQSNFTGDVNTLLPILLDDNGINQIHDHSDKDYGSMHNEILNQVDITTNMQTEELFPWNNIIEDNAKELFKDTGCTGDNALANQMKYSGLQAQQAIINRANWNKGAANIYFEEELEEQESKIWWGNDEYILANIHKPVL